MTVELAVEHKIKVHFLAHQRLWASFLLLFWMLGNIVLLATSKMMESSRAGYDIPLWQPIAQEVSSSLVMLMLFVVLLRCWSFMQERYSLLMQGVLHLLLTLPFSLLHIYGMVWLRKFWYGLMGTSYHFSEIGFGLLYEYRKDLVTYITVFVLINGYLFVVRRLRGEASYVERGEQSSALLADRLLVKKLGKEFLIAVEDIDWVEASGNYANLHVSKSVYPMRITMAKLTSLLPDSLFCRVHRSSIVNLSRVDHLVPLESGDCQVYLVDGCQLSLSRRYRDAFKAKLVVQ